MDALQALVRRNGTVCYYLFSLMVIQFIFSTVQCGADHRLHAHHKLADYLTNTFVASFAVSAPLMYEFALDQFLAWYHPKYSQTLSNRRLADALVISSIFVPGVVNLISVKLSLWFAHLIVCLGGCLLMCGMYGRLLSLSSARWGLLRCMLLLAIYTVSQIFAVHFAKFRDDDFTLQHVNLSIAIALKAACLALHLFSSRHLFIRSSSVEVVSKSEGQLVAKYSQIVNSVIISLFLVFQLGFLSAAAANGRFDDCLLQYELCLLIATAIVAGAKPGRVVRLSMMNLQNEIEYKETFVRYISHEIRSPLSTTTLGLDYLLQQMSSKLISYDEALEVIKDAKISADLATSTMNDLLMFDKINSSSFEIFTAVTTAWPFIIKCVKPFRTQARVSKLNLTCTIDREDNKNVTVLIDEPKIEQVVRNFITNAIKFTQAGGTLTLEVSVRPGFSNNYSQRMMVGDKGVLRFSLKDTGPGISKENLPKLFGQYVQFDANKLQHGSGSGLGLWLSKSIVEMHGGYIGAYSEGEGKGCEFYFELPCYSFTPPPVETSGTGSSLARSLHYSSGVTVHKAAEASPPRTVRKTGLMTPGTSSRTMHSYPGAMLPMHVQARLQDLANRIAAATGSTMSAKRNRASSADTQLLCVNEKDESTRDSERTVTARPVPVLAGAQDPLSVVTLDTQGDAYISPSQECVEKVGRFLKVLLADDSPLSRKMLARTLQSLCSVVDHASNGLDALNAVVASVNTGAPFDVVIIDNYMPVMNGADAIAAMRQQGYKGVILAVTGSTAPDVQENLVGAGADAVILKPLNIETFKTTMNELMESSRVDQPVEF